MIIQSIDDLHKLSNMEGSFGFLAKSKDIDDNYVIKVFKNTKQINKEILFYLLSKPFIKDSGYPLDIVSLNDEIIGYLLTYYKDSYTYANSLIRKNITYQEKVKSTIDCTNQLKQVHSYNLLFNDISLNNQIINKDGGHLIDFDSISFENKKTTKTSFYLTINGAFLESSYNLDKLKQALINLSLILEIDIEDIARYRTNDIKSLISLFKDLKEIYNLLSNYLSSTDNIPYFDSLINLLQDEEKISYYKDKIYKKSLYLI